MCCTEIGPFTGEGIDTARKLNDRKMQRAQLQFFKPSNYLEVRRSLLEACRGDLIGSGCDAPTPNQPAEVRFPTRMTDRPRPDGRAVVPREHPRRSRAGRSPPFP